MKDPITRSRTSGRGGGGNKHTGLRTNGDHTQCRSDFKNDRYCIPPKPKRKDQILVDANRILFQKPLDIARITVATTVIDIVSIRMCEFCGEEWLGWLS